MRYLLRGSAGRPAGADAGDPEGPNIFQAIQRQLGLTLEEKKAPMEMLVVDRAHKIPVEN